MHENEKWKWRRSVVSDSLQPHGLQPTRLLRQWDFPGKSTGVRCQCTFYKSLANFKENQESEIGLDCLRILQSRTFVFLEFYTLCGVIVSHLHSHTCNWRVTDQKIKLFWYRKNDFFEIRKFNFSKSILEQMKTCKVLIIIFSNLGNYIVKRLLSYWYIKYV